MIDYYLLENYEKLEEFAQIEHIGDLNAFEKCLLVHAFRTRDASIAESVYDLIQMSSKLKEFEVNKTS